MTLPEPLTEELKTSVTSFLDEHPVIGSTDEEIEVTANLGFAGEDLRGVLSLGFQYQFLKLTHPMGSEAILKEEELEDWAGEIVNQVVGRFKNKLLPYKVNIVLATPTVVSGEKLEVKKGKVATYSEWVGDKAKLKIHFECEILKNIDFSNKEETEDDNAAEGSALMF